MVASRRGLGRPAAPRRWAASVSASRMVEPCAVRSGTEPLLLAGKPQGVDQIIEVAIQHVGEVVDGVVDTMIGQTILRKVVGANLGRAVARAHLGPAAAGPGRFLPGDRTYDHAVALYLESTDHIRH